MAKEKVYRLAENLLGGLSEEGKEAIFALLWKKRMEENIEEELALYPEGTEGLSEEEKEELKSRLLYSYSFPEYTSFWEEMKERICRLRDEICSEREAEKE